MYRILQFVFLIAAVNARHKGQKNHDAGDDSLNHEDGDAGRCIAGSKLTNPVRVEGVPQCLKCICHSTFQWYCVYLNEKCTSAVDTSNPLCKAETGIIGKPIEIGLCQTCKCVEGSMVCYTNRKPGCQKTKPKKKGKLNQYSYLIIPPWKLPEGEE